MIELSSKISGFYKKTIKERLEKVKEISSLSDDDIEVIANGKIEMDLVNRMVENVIGVMPVPLGIAVNFQVNGNDYLVPMAVEETSVIAGASNAAKMARVKGGFTCTNTGPVMIGQIQAVDTPDPFGAKMRILEAKKQIIEIADKQDPILVKFGGGCKDIRVRVLDSKIGPLVITEILVNCGDAAGMNAVNSMNEALAPLIEELSGGKVQLRIISNLADKRLVRCRAIFDKDAIGGEDVVNGIIAAYAFAEADPYRCATHNKGIMNGIDAVIVSTGNDWRAIEAGAHAYAATKDSGNYSSLTTWEKNQDGDLVGTIELPMAVGLVGGVTKIHPVAQRNVKILGVKKATELGEIATAVGLAQNFAALLALSTVGIQKGHMSLHARNIAIQVGAEGKEIEKIATQMASERKIREDRARELLDDLRG
ncbi:MAG: hydroxymethylglutaryl-CoA reductase, degradative [Candidatus Heimdallarchaeota archaeon]